MYKSFLAEIGYLLPAGDDFSTRTDGVDDEVAVIAGPQLVAPVDNARYALNAANARWGSLYDALYATEVEGFNRTIQKQFVDYHEDELFHDLAGFNRKLANWLIDDNTVLPHHSLGLQSPVNFLIQNQPERQRGWTCTRHRLTPRPQGVILRAPPRRLKSSKE